MPVNAPAEILPTHTPQLFAAAVDRAAELLRRGEVVALPTETVYGLAANALNADAVQRIYAVKERPGHNPIIIHVSDLAMARGCVATWPGSAEKLATAFWPGPLTLVLARADTVPSIVTAGGPTVGVRWPAHPLMQAVIRACGFPLAAPSANLANDLSPTSADHVRRSLGTRIPLIVDGGQAQVGIESTVIDLTVSPPRVLRPGMIHAESLVAVVGAFQPEAGDAPGTLRSPGLLKKHYAPKAKLVVLSWRDERDLETQVAAAARMFQATPERTFIIAHGQVPMGTAFGQVSVIPHDAEAFARAIYSELHRCDAEGAALIVVEAVPETEAWRGIADRLRRASSG